MPACQTRASTRGSARCLWTDQFAAASQASQGNSAKVGLGMLVSPSQSVHGHQREGRWALVLPLLSTPVAHPSCRFRCVLYHYNHLLAMCWYKTQPQAIFFFPKSLISLAVPWCRRACCRAQLPLSFRASTSTLAQIQ